MARYTGPKNKLSRREGVDLIAKGVKLRRLNVPPGAHGQKMRGKKLSNYGQQLREKQKMKRMYGVLEKQFSNYVADALKSKGNTGERLIQSLESRLDNCLFRSGIIKTRTMARQFVVHGHVKVNDIKVDRPSYRVKPDDIITLSEKVLSNPDVMKLINVSDNNGVEWITRQSGVLKIARIPLQEDISEPINMAMVVEYYSR